MSDWKGQRWEYHVATKPVGSVMQDSELDRFGEWGWELVAVFVEAALPSGINPLMVYTFKRPVQQAKIELP